MPLAPLLLGMTLAAGDALPDGAAVLPETAIPMMLSQCSRGVPEAGEEGWLPAPQDIRRLEAALPDALAEQRPLARRADLTSLFQDWMRQYVGIVRDGRRYIYGNYWRGRGILHGLNVNWRTVPLVVCDGGPTYFGVEYDVEAGRFTHFGFNGEA